MKLTKIILAASLCTFGLSVTACDKKEEAKKEDKKEGDAKKDGEKKEGEAKEEAKE